MTWPPHQMTWHASKQVTSPPWNSRRLVHSKEMVWASRWSVALRTFYRQILSLLYIFFLLKLPPPARPGTTCKYVCLYAYTKTCWRCATNCKKMPLQHSTQCSDKRIQDSNQIAIAHLACEQKMSRARCLVLCSNAVPVLILYLDDLLCMHATEGHCWHILSACMKVHQYKHGKEA